MRDGCASGVPFAAERAAGTSVYCGMTRMSWTGAAPWLYDTLMRPLERGALARWRRALWADVPAVGLGLEVGFGTNANAAYRPASARVVGIDLSGSQDLTAMAFVVETGFGIDRTEARIAELLDEGERSHRHDVAVLVRILAAAGRIHHCDCNAIPGIMGFGEMADIAGLIAPRAFCAIHGRTDPLFPPDQIARAVEDCARIFQAAGVAERAEDNDDGVVREFGVWIVR